MLKLTKKADYGLIALRHLACQAKTGSAKEIADRYRIPLPLLSKVLQTLPFSERYYSSDRGLVTSVRLVIVPAIGVHDGCIRTPQDDALKAAGRVLREL